MNQVLITKIVPHLGFILVYILWGINITSLKIGGREWDPVVFNGLRFSSIIPFLWAYTYVYYRSRSQRMRIEGKDLLLVCCLGVLNALGMEVLLQYALQFSSSANGAVLGRGFMPIITVIFTLAVRQVQFTWRIAVGIPLAFIGVIVLVSGGADGIHLGSDTLRGDILLLLRSFMGAIYLIGMNRLVLKYPLTLLISIEMTAGALSLLPFVFWNADLAYFARISSVGWISLGYTAIFATVVGFTVHNWSLARLGPFQSSAYGYLLPLTAAVAGYLIIGESITWTQCIGGAGVLIAMYLVQRDRMQTSRQTVASNRSIIEKKG